VEEALVTEFLLALFEESIEPTCIIQKLVALPIKQVGLVVQPDPKETSGSCHGVSTEICSHTYWPLLGRK
jgi:hypothetical protein